MKYTRYSTPSYAPIWHLALNTLVCQRIVTLPMIQETATALKAAKIEMDMLDSDYKQKQSQQDSYKKSVADLKESILAIVRAPREQRDESALTAMIQSLDMSEGFYLRFSEEAREASSKYHPAEDRYVILKWEAEKQEGTEKLLGHYLGIERTHHFIEASETCYDFSHMRVSTTEHKTGSGAQKFQFIKLVQLFPEWHIERIAYLLTLQGLMEFDNQASRGRDYGVGLAKDLIGDVFKNPKELWCKRHDGKSKQPFKECWRELETWLMSPLTTEELIEDPHVQAFARIWQDKEWGFNESTYKGGMSFIGQLREFIPFVQSHLTEAVEA